MTRGPWFTVGVLTVANILGYLDRQVMGLLVVPIGDDLGLSDIQISLLMGFAFAIFYAIFGLPIGRLVDVGVRRFIVAGGIALWSIATALCGLARSFVGLFAARVGVGVGEAALAPAAYSMIGDLFPPNRRGMAIAVFTTGSGLGSGLALVLAAVVFAFLEQYEQITLPVLGTVQPWQVVFFVVGLPGLLVAALALTVREPKRADASISAVVPMRDVWKHIKGQSTLLLLVIGGFSLMAVKAYGISAWIPTFLIRTHGLSVGEAGTYFGLVIAVSSTSGMLLGGRFSDWLSNRGVRDAKIRTAIGGNLLTLVPIVSYPLATDVTTSLILIGTYYVFAAMTTPMGIATLQEITPPRMRGQLSAIYLFVVTIVGMGLGPLSVALITDLVFENPADLRYSLAIVPLVTVSVALILVMRARTEFLKLHAHM